MGLKSRNGYGKGTWVTTDMILSSAFLALNPPAKDILLLFLLKRDIRYVNFGKNKKQKQCVNCNSLTMTYKELEAEPLKFTHSRITRGIDDLLAKGFIEIKHHGGCFQKDKSVYGLVEDWRCWIKGMVIRKRTKDIKRGFQKKRSAKNKAAVEIGE